MVLEKTLETNENTNSFLVVHPLDDVLKHIKQATRTPNHPDIPIYVDPLVLQEAERSLDSTVSIDLEGVPLKTTLAHVGNMVVPS